MNPPARIPTTKTRGAERVVVDLVLQSPVDQALRRQWKRLLWIVIALVLIYVVIKIVGHFAVDKPVTYQTDDDHFRYGSIGSEPGGSLLHPVGGMLPPYQVFAVLPDMFPDKLPGGYAALGLIFENGPDGKPRDLPIGISRRQRLGTDLVGLNCAVCHVGTLRTRADAPPQIISGMPAHQLDLKRLFSFVLDSVLDPRFTTDNVVGHIEKKFGPLSFGERLLTTVSLPQVRERTLLLQSRVGLLFSPAVTAWGRGRVDTFNPYKALQFNWPLDRLPPLELSAASDFPALWNQAPRAHLSLHWDGNNGSLDERNLSAGLGAGITPVTVDHAAIARIKSYIGTLPAPRWPESPEMPIDHARAARGGEIYQRDCASCHEFNGAKIGQVEPLKDIGTDPARFNSYTTVFADNQNTLFPDSPHRFHNFHKTVGYVNQPLDGIWARAPYLHNGSVPTLEDLLKPPAERPAEFYRGYDVYDPQRVGFVSNVARDGLQTFTKFVTTAPGNSNSGHLYGTTLPAEAKRDLLEFLKTL